MKRGRPRKAPDESAGVTGAHYQRWREASKNPVLESTFGRLAFQGEFTEYQVETREKVLRIYRECRAHMGISGSAASPSLEIGIGRSPAFEDFEAKERAEAALKAFHRIQDVLAKFASPARFAFHELCINERICPPGLLAHVKAVLDVLATVLGYKLHKKRLDKSKAVAD